MNVSPLLQPVQWQLLRGQWPVSYTHLDVYKRQHTHTHTHTCMHALSFHWYHNVHSISHSNKSWFTAVYGQTKFPHAPSPWQSNMRKRISMYSQFLLIPCLLLSTALLNETNYNVLFVLLSCPSNIDTTLLQTHCAYINLFMTCLLYTSRCV